MRNVSVTADGFY